MTRTKTAREVALEVLVRVDEFKSYSNLELKAVLDREPLSAVDAGLVTELVYGTIQRRNTLDDVLSRFIKGKGGLAKLQPWVLHLLRLSLYQIRYLDRIPDRAAVHEAVEIAKRRGHQGIASLVNGVLRNVLRQPECFEVLPTGSLAKRLAVELSHPEWLVARWLKLYGEEATRAMCESNNLPPHTSVRVNQLKTGREELISAMLQHFPHARPSMVSAAGIVVDGGHVAGTSWFREGQCTIQDESSMLVAPALKPLPGQRVLDACAAPGGKTTHIAELMNNVGEIVACDVHAHKQELIRQNAKRLSIEIITPVVADAAALTTAEHGTFDRILLDAPCTGLGVIRRKPDLKWQKNSNDIKQIAKLQAELLECVSKLLAPGGLLVYSTCTIDPEENQQVVERFVAAHPEFELDTTLAADLPEAVRAQAQEKGYVQILPHQFQSDGFFISRLKRKA
ncbi:16S rRNA (cytosine(967)-C(5))-methyltransferase RsmB [Brevibacillus fluminis]|uniref:16S rRNA (cytosine(967)-C(5))-methyltransferase RsmB n=1 Tax=Brevibacillus fluminis TaxID=511487 RepID=UPI003F8A7318